MKSNYCRGIWIPARQNYFEKAQDMQDENTEVEVRENRKIQRNVKLEKRFRNVKFVENGRYTKLKDRYQRGTYTLS